MNNTAGFIGAKNALSASTQFFANAGGGVVLGQAAVTINTNGAGYDNRGGQTQAVGDLRIDAGAIDNTAGLIRSTCDDHAQCGHARNAGTLGADQGIEGKNVAISVGHLDNTSGAIRADINVTVTSGGSVNNTARSDLGGDTLASPIRTRAIRGQDARHHQHQRHAGGRQELAARCRDLQWRWHRRLGQDLSIGSRRTREQRGKSAPTVT